LVCQHASELDKLIDTQLFRAKRKKIMRLFRKLKMTLQGIPQCLPAMVETRLDHPVKNGFITAKAISLVAFKADDGGLNLWRWMEDLWWYPEQEFNIIPGLQEY
jgi:hypothetical protein